jgi:hypothetical protein
MTKPARILRRPALPKVEWFNAQTNPWAGRLPSELCWINYIDDLTGGHNFVSVGWFDGQTWHNWNERQHQSGLPVTHWAPIRYPNDPDGRQSP